MVNNNRNRAGRRGNDSRGSNSNQNRQSTSASAAGSRDGNNPIQNRKGGKGSSNLSKSTDNIQNGPATSQGSLPPPEEQAPTPGFNAQAVEAALRQGLDGKASLYKPDAKAQPTSPPSPWGAKPGAMANGKDFWIDLRRQVAGLQQTRGVSQGG